MFNRRNDTTNSSLSHHHVLHLCCPVGAWIPYRGVICQNAGPSPWKEMSCICKTRD